VHQTLLKATEGLWLIFISVPCAWSSMSFLAWVVFDLLDRCLHCTAVEHGLVWLMLHIPWQPWIRHINTVLCTGCVITQS